MCRLFQRRPDVLGRRQTVLEPEVLQPGGKRKRVPMSLKEFREGLPSLDQSLFDLNSGCGCFLEDAA